MITVRAMYQKYVFGHSRHTFSQYSNEGKTCQKGSSFVIPLTPIQAVLPFKGPGAGLQGNLFLMISGTIQACPMTLCTFIVPLKAYHNTKRNFLKSDL